MKKTTTERFWAKVDKSGECWLWTGAVFNARRNRNKYGHFRGDADQRDWLAHRYSWVEANGPIPEGLQVNHHCDETLCVRQTHLYLGTQKENVSDMDRRGRRPRPVMDRVRQLMREWGVSQRTVFERLRAEREAA